STALVAVGLIAFTPIGDNLMNTRSGLERLSIEGRDTPEPVSDPVVVLDTAESDNAGAGRSHQQQAPDREQAIADSGYIGGIAAPAPASAPQMMTRKVGPMDGTVSGSIVAEPSAQIALPNTETFANEDANPVHVTAEDPVSTFSIDVDTA